MRIFDHIISPVIVHFIAVHDRSVNLMLLRRLIVWFRLLVYCFQTSTNQKHHRKCRKMYIIIIAVIGRKNNFHKGDNRIKKLMKATFHYLVFSPLSFPLLPSFLHSYPFLVFFVFCAAERGSSKIS